MQVEESRILPIEERQQRTMEISEERRQLMIQTAEQRRIEAEEKQREMREIAEQRRASLEQRIQEEQDEQRRMTADRVALNFNNVQERLINNFLRVIDNLETVLVNITTAADRMESQDVDVSEAREAIDQAEDALIEARAAINTLSAKEYSSDDYGDISLSGLLRSLRDDLHGDMLALRELMHEAREAVVAARAALASAQPEIIDNEI